MPARTVSLGAVLRVLDARPDRLDLRDLPYRPPVLDLPPCWPDDATLARWLPAYRAAGLVLDQGKDGACTGFGLAAVINFLLWRRDPAHYDKSRRVSPWMLYRLARLYDEWPGERYEGSSCRGALKGWHRHGVCAESLWTARGRRPLAPWAEDAVRSPLGVYYRVERQSVVDLQAAIVQAGAVYAAANVHTGWQCATTCAPDSHAALPRITPMPGFAGHAFALVGYNADGFIVQNAWGEDWGACGFAVLPYEDWVANGQDAWVAGLGVPLNRAPGGGSLASPRHLVSGRPGGNGLLAASRPEAPSDSRWSLDAAYAHTLVLDAQGDALARLADARDDADAMELVAREHPLAAFRAAPRGTPRRLAVIALDGLEDEHDALARVRELGPLWQARGRYPVFLLLREGWRARCAGSLATAGILPGTTAAAHDRALEAHARDTGLHARWQAQHSALRDEGSPAGPVALAGVLNRLARAAGRSLGIELVGHGAGALTLLPLLDRITVSRCCLLAPACPVDHARRTLAAAVAAGRLPASGLSVHVLSPGREASDAFGTAGYGGSWLQFVSRALSRWHRTPLAGLADAYAPGCTSAERWHPATLTAVHDWQTWWAGAQVAGARLCVEEHGGPLAAEPARVLAERD